MTDFHSIEIDLDVYKRIETERKSFSEAPNEVLRRLLQIEGKSSDGKSPSFRPLSHKERPWTGKGVILPHGTHLRMNYNGRIYIGRIENGTWVVEGKIYKSPSAAAGGVAITKQGKQTSLDGWIYWWVKLPNEHEWKSLNELRHKKV